MWLPSTPSSMHNLPRKCTQRSKAGHDPAGAGHPCLLCAGGSGQQSGLQRGAGVPQPSGGGLALPPAAKQHLQPYPERRDNNYLWNWVAPYYGGWDDIPENILAAYDTYSCTGLPAGPISNPGLAAIKAALEPQPDEEAKNAYFFVTDLKGNYYYAHTLAEHNANCKTAAAVNKNLKN